MAAPLINFRLAVNFTKFTRLSSLACDQIHSDKDSDMYLQFTDCHSPPVSPGAMVNYSSATYGSAVTYSCEEGYKATSGDPVLSCGESGWLGVPLTCAIKSRLWFLLSHWLSVWGRVHWATRSRLGHRRPLARKRVVIRLDTQVFAGYSLSSDYRKRQSQS